MSTNLEIKARCDDLAVARERAKAVATSWVGIHHQTDTYFRTARGRLKLRESSAEGAHLVPYLRPDREDAKTSDYQLLPVEDPDGLKRLLTEILGVHRVVRKTREIAMYENVRIHLDRVDGLGTFLELEAVYEGGEAALPEQQEKVDFLSAQLGVRPEDRVAISYEGLLARGVPEPRDAD